MMIRTEISIEAELRSRIRARTKALGISTTEYFRQLAERDLSESPRHVDRAPVFNLGASGGADVGRRKDDMAADAVRARKLRSR